MKLKEMLSDYQLGEQPNWDGEQIITGITDGSAKNSMETAMNNEVM